MRPPRDWFARLSLLLSVVSVAYLIYSTAATEAEWLQTSSPWSGIFWALLGAGIASYFGYIVRTLHKNPTPVKIALVGRPGTGKTVFLTVLFDRIQTIRASDLSLAPYGRETIDQVASTIREMTRGRWPAKTSPNSVAFYRATATIYSRLIRRRYTVELADYAGESISQFDSSDPAFLHRTSYFRYVTGCDSLILAVDSEVIRKNNRRAVMEMQNDLIAALQIIIDEKGLTSDRMLEEPVALAFLKSDLLRTEDERKRALQAMNKLCAVCTNRCRQFRVFFVSAVGQHVLQRQPPDQLEPENVLEPVAWSLKNMIV